MTWRENGGFERQDLGQRLSPPEYLLGLQDETISSALDSKEPFCDYVYSVQGGSLAGLY